MCNRSMWCLHLWLYALHLNFFFDMTLQAWLVHVEMGRYKYKGNSIEENLKTTQVKLKKGNHGDDCPGQRKQETS